LISAKELALKLDISQRAVEKHIANLKQQGRLERSGPAKGGKWTVR